MTFSEYVEHGLAAKGWTRYRLAKLLGRSVTGINQLVKGAERSGVSEELLREIAALLDLDGDLLVILSAELYPQGTVRWRYSKLLEEVVNLREENRRLRGPGAVA